MRKKYIYMAALSVLVFFLISHAQEQKKTEWQGRIETIDGIKVITNPNEPAFGEIRFELEEDLVLGSEKNEDDIFTRPVYIQVDADGNIYVNDVRERRIRKITSDGKYLKDVGRAGQGPGEFQNARKLWVDDRSGGVYVTSYLKIVVFDKKGANKNNIRLKRLSTDMYMDADGNIWSKSFDITESGVFHIFEKISQQGEILKEIVRFPETIATATVGRSGEAVTVVTLEHGYEYKLFISNVDDQSFVYGYSEDYELNKFNKNGDLLCKIRVEEPGQRFTGKEKSKIMSKFERFSKAARENVKIPITKPFFESIFSDSEGRIYVQRVKSPLDESEKFVYDIFSPEGHFLYKTTFPHKPHVIKRGYFYTYYMDEDRGAYLVKRFKIKNWDQIKKGL